MDYGLRLISSNRVGGIVVPFVDRRFDAYETFWDANSDFGIAPHQYRQRPIFFHHALLGKKRGKAFRYRIGTLDDNSFRLEALGLYAEGDLEEDEANIEAVLEARKLLRASLAAWSSGVMPHQIEMEERSGYIRSWPIVEASILHKQDAGDRSFTTKAYHIRKAGIYLPDTIEDDEELLRSPIINLRTDEMDRDELLAVVTQAVAPLSQEVMAIRASQEEIANRLTVLEVAEPPAPATRVAGQLPAPIVVPSPVPSITPRPIFADEGVRSIYDGVSLFAMLLHDRFRQIHAIQNEGRNHVRTEEFMRALLSKIEAQQKLDDEAHTWYRDNPDMRHLFQVPYRCIDADARAMWQTVAPNLRANEVMGSTVAGKGDELVPTLLNSVAHWSFMLETRIVQLFPRFFMPSNSFDYPTITAWPNFHRITELVNQSNMDIPNSPIVHSNLTTSKVSFVANSMGVAIAISRELLEDSAVPMMEAVATGLSRSSAQQMDYVALNGHELDTKDNISYYSAAGTAPSANSETRLLVMNGLRYMGLFTFAGAASATDSATDIAGAVAASLGYKLGLKMGTRGRMGLDPKKSVLIADAGVAHGINALSGYEQAYAVGESRATLLTGVVNVLKGIPVVATDQIPLTNAAGAIPAAANGTLATALRVYTENVRVGFRREISMEMGKVQGVDGYEANVSVRFDIQEMEDKAVVIGYNITEPT